MDDGLFDGNGKLYWINEVSKDNVIDKNIVSGVAVAEATHQETTTPVKTETLVQEEVIKVDEPVAEIGVTPPAITSPPSITPNNYSSNLVDIIDGISLNEMEFPALFTIVENLLHTGLAVLASVPKVGKSWFCLLLCLAVATGKEFLGFKTHKCEVLYLSFESDMRSLQVRLRMLLQDDEMPEGIYFSDKRRTLDNGLLDFFQETIDKKPDIKLIIMDTLQFIRSQKIKGGTQYNKEYKEMNILKEFADKNKVCILGVHHLKNQPSKDVFAQMYGSNGIRGATDVNMVLTKLQDEHNRVLFSIEGRNVESTNKIIKLNPTNCKWEVALNDVDLEEMKYRENPIAIIVNKLLQENPNGIEITMTELKNKMCEELGILEEEYAPQAISREIGEHLIPLFMRYDNIRCKKPNKNGGAKGRYWYFSYQQTNDVIDKETSSQEDETHKEVL